MKKFLFLALLFPIVAMSQTVPVTVVVNWDAPTTTVLGTPLTGAQALTKYQIFAATASIPDNSLTAPVVEPPANATSGTFTMSVANGSTIYVRVKACNAGGCSLFSTEATKAVQVPSPNAPGNVKVVVTIIVSTQ